MEIAEKNRQMEIAYRQLMLERDTKLKEKAEAKDRIMQLALADKELQQMQERQAILESVKIMQKAFEEKSERDMVRVKEREAGECIEIARLIDAHQAIRLEERGKDKPKADYRPEYRKTGANELNKQNNSGYAPSKE